MLEQDQDSPGETIIISTTLDMTEKNHRFPSKRTTRMFVWFNHFVGPEGTCFLLSLSARTWVTILGTRSLNRMLGAEGQLFAHPIVVALFNGGPPKFPFQC